MKGLNLWQQFWYYLGHNGTYVLQQFNHHFAISVYGVLLAALVGIPESYSAWINSSSSAS